MDARRQSMNWELLGTFIAASLFGIIICGFVLLLLALYAVTR
jgi:hypothetical protein